MRTAFYILKLIIKFLLFIIFLPLILLWFLFKYWRFILVLKHNLIKSGMPRQYANEIAKAIKPTKIFSKI